MWFSAKILYTCTIESDDNSESELFEESILLLEAENENEAEIKAMSYAKDREHNYLNFKGERIKWNFKRILEIQDLDEEKIYSGMEVFSKLFGPTRQSKSDDTAVSESAHDE